jgi:hypothetical protein
MEPGVRLWLPLIARRVGSPRAELAHQGLALRVEGDIRETGVAVHPYCLYRHVLCSLLPSLDSLPCVWSVIMPP